MEGDTDSDYTNPLSLIGGFDMGISFDDFGENMKRLMELPMKYLDTAHDKAVDLVEDIHAIICAPFPGDEIPNKANETLKDPSSDNVITRSSAESVAMELADPNEELSSPSISTAQNSFTDSIATVAHQIESILTESPESNSSDGGDMEVNDQCMLPVDASATEISITSCSNGQFSSLLPSDSCINQELISPGRTVSTPVLLGKSVSVEEEVLLCNSEKPSDTSTSEDPTLLGRTVCTEEEVILWNPGKPVNLQPPESSACDGATILVVTIANGEEQTSLYTTNDPEESTKHGDLSNLPGVTLLHDLTTDVSSTTYDPNIWLDDPVEFVDINLRDDQERTEADVSSFPQPKSTSFKKKLMKSLSNKFRWSKKERNVNQNVPVRSQEAGNVSYQAVSSSDDLEDDWELL